MTERPILFNGPMVRAILSGQKTQTRRPVTNGTPYWQGNQLMFNEKRKGGFGPSHAVSWCPYGFPRDRLWVRETWAAFDLDWRHVGPPDDLKGGPWPNVLYAATASEKWENPRWRPSIHMPRWASRVMLEITGVRVEPLHHLKTQDACAEGFDNQTAFLNAFEGRYEAKYGRNPWVWVVEFRKV